jgi:hypothetical protein
MALTPILSFQAQNLSKLLIVTDATVYGGSNLDRNEVEVTLQALKIKNNEVQTEYDLTYDPLTVTAWSINIGGDGWYRLILTITEIADPENVETKQYDFVLTQKLCDCFVRTSYGAFKDSTCGCENNDFLTKLYCMEGQIKGLEVMVAQGDYDSADKTLDRLNQECALLNKKGCGC